MTEKIDHFNIAQIAASGQCFRIRLAEDDTWSIIAKDRYLRLRVQDPGENGSQICDFDCDREEFDSFWVDYFDLDTDYARIDRLADPADSYLTEAVKYGRGLRILRQDLWETIISFTISQRKSIPAISRCVGKLSHEYGKKIDEKIYAFPEPQDLFGVPSDDLSECGLGYRSKYIWSICRLISDGLWDLKKAADPSLTDAEVIEYLSLLPGVGAKIANCVSLFGLHGNPLMSGFVGRSVEILGDAVDDAGFQTGMIRKNHINVAVGFTRARAFVPTFVGLGDCAAHVVNHIAGEECVDGAGFFVGCRSVGGNPLRCRFVVVGFEFVG